jgi:gas vesicle protein
MTKQKPSSHIGAGLAAGAVIGLAAGFFLNSRKGKVLVADAQKNPNSCKSK